MATDMIVRKVSGGGDQFVRDRAVRVSRENAGASDNRRLDGDHIGRDGAAYGSASPELESSDTSEDGSSWMHGFEKGDMVWGKVKSHPWWPGHIFHEDLASPSVRRSRREGHVLVAFFGDSSYGWFEPAELLPFDPHFAEKSKQTTSRNFLKAVEEAVDEVSRRRALGLSCLCRSPHNFRPASIPGHYAVDVIGYESGVVYSARQIKRARDSFVPGDVVSLTRKLATVRHVADNESLEMTKIMATVLSIRKALYEEFDDTYAQAFGVEPVRPARNELGVVELPAKIAPRAAPLTGPLVFAEALGKKKGDPAFVRSATKAAKDQAKKNKYLFKRRDDAPPAATDHAAASPPPSAGAVIVAHGPLGGVEHPTPPAPAAGATAVKYVSDSGGYVLQKRQLPAEDSYGQPTALPDEGARVSPRGPDVKKKPGLFAQSPSADVKDVGLPVAGSDTAKPLQKQEDRKPPASQPDILDTKPAITDHQATLGLPRKPSHDATVSGFVVGDDQKKKKKKRPPLRQEDEADTGDLIFKKKRKKQSIDPQTGLPVVPVQDQLEVVVTAREPSAQGTRKSPDVAVPQDSKGSVASETRRSPVPDVAVPASFSSITLPNLDIKGEDLDFKQLVPDLKALALDPFHGNERNVSDLVRRAFLLFRSLVYQKSLPLRPLNEKSDAPSQQEVQPRVGGRPDAAAVPPPAPQRTVTGSAVGTVAPAVEEREQKPKLPSGLAAGPSKTASEALLSRPDDPTRAGRKRPLSDRQEERIAMKEKKLKQVKQLAFQKKAALKASDGKPKETGTALPAVRKPLKPNEEAKETGAPTAAKKVTMDPQSSIKKPQDAAVPAPAPKVPSPTFLVMKFPPRSTLPSISSLKARFGRFGPLDVDACRVFWKTYTCKVQFKFRADAVVAYNHVKTNTIFGQIDVSYSLRDVDVATAPAADAPETEKRGPAPAAPEVSAAPRSEAASVQFRPPARDSLTPPSALKKPLLLQSQPSVQLSALKKPQQQIQSQPAVQLKSILKKPAMDDSATGANGAREAPRVKFMIDENVEDNNNNNDRPNPSSGNHVGAGGSGGNGNGGVNGTPEMRPDVESFNSKISRLLAPAQIPRPTPPVVPMSRPSEAYRAAFPQTVTSRPVVTPDRRFLPFGKSQQLQPNAVRRDGAGPSGTAAARNVDISSEMLSLLRRCRDIVSTVQSTLGYAAYRPL